MVDAKKLERLLFAGYTRIRDYGRREQFGINGLWHLLLRLTGALSQLECGDVEVSHYRKLSLDHHRLPLSSLLYALHRIFCFYLYATARVAPS